MVNDMDLILWNIEYLACPIDTENYYCISCCNNLNVVAWRELRYIRPQLKVLFVLSILYFAVRELHILILLRSRR